MSTLHQEDHDWLVDINKDMSLGVLKNIKVNRLPGPDGIYPRIEKYQIQEDLGLR